MIAPLGAAHADGATVASLASAPSGNWSVDDDAPPSSRQRAQERAFRHWAIPGSRSPSSADASDPNVAAPEESFEQGVASFRVYTPAELAMRPVRANRARPPPSSVVDEIYDGLVNVRGAGLRALFKWLAIGIAVGAALLVALVVIGNLTDDTRIPADKRPYASVSPTTKLIPPIAPNAVTAPVTDDQGDTAFELPDESAPAGAPRTGHQRGARAPAAAAPKKKPGEVRIMRNAPF